MSTSKEHEMELEKVQQEQIKKLDTSRFTHHKLSVEESLKKLGVDVKTHLKTGLSDSEVKKRQAEFGPNELAKDDDPTLWERILEQFKDQLVQILLGSACITFVFACLEEDGGFAAFVEPFVIMTILILNAIVAIYQDSNADSALEALMDMTAQQSRVLRGSEWLELDTKELVPGDVVQLKVGDIVPADVRVAEIKSISLMAEQAALTGESDSVKKTIAVMGNDAKMLQDQKNILFASTKITSGHAIGVVAYTGMNTAIGCVKEEVDKAKNEEADTPLKQKLDQFSDQLAKIIFIICGLVWAMNFFKFSDPIHGGFIKGCIYYFKIAVALAVAAIPEGLPAVITTCLALGTRKMAKNNCVVRRLPSVETLGCTSTICSDKTGTLTKNLMCAVRFGVVGESCNNIIDFEVEEKAYNPIGEIKLMTQANFDQNKNFGYLQMVCALNNRARIRMEQNRFKNEGEPTEAALIVLAEKLGKFQKHSVTHSEQPMGYSDWYNKNYERVATLDFSSERKTMSTVVKGGPNQNWVLLKGAPERVIDRCNGILKSNGEAEQFKNKEQKEQLLSKIRAEASKGFRVLGMAIAKDGGRMKHLNANNLQQELADPSRYVELESDCQFVGYVCIRDPPRDEVKGSIAQCRTAGVNVIMITGDAKETAVAIAKELNILDANSKVEGSCWTGAEFEEMTLAQRKAALKGRKGKVFARVEPRHKRELVKVLMDMVSNIQQ
jgi:Ca2+-transporting ATPase